jgi:hypothetical protein
MDAHHPFAVRKMRRVSYHNPIRFIRPIKCFPVDSSVFSVSVSLRMTCPKSAGLWTFYVPEEVADC